MGSRDNERDWEEDASEADSNADELEEDAEAQDESVEDDSDADAEAESESDEDSDADADAKSESDEDDSGADTDAESESNEDDSGADADAESESDEDDSDVDTDPESESVEDDSGADADAEGEFDDHSDAAAESDSDEDDSDAEEGTDRDEAEYDNEDSDADDEISVEEAEPESEGDDNDADESEADGEFDEDDSESPQLEDDPASDEAPDADAPELEGEDREWDMAAEDNPIEPHVVLEASDPSVEVLVVDERGRRLSGVPLRLVLADGSELDATTDASGLVRWEDAGTDDGARLTSRTALGALRRSTTLRFESLEELDVPPEELDDDGSPRLSDVAVVDRVDVKGGDTLASIASQRNLGESELCLFNWGTSDSQAVQERLRWDVGCTKMSDDQESYLLDDADPGVLYVPRKLDTKVQSGRRYVLRGRAIRPFYVVLKNSDGMPVPEAEFELSFSDGSTREGRLGRAGVAMIEDPPWSTIHIRYKDLADVRAKSLAGKARKGFGDRDLSKVYEVLWENPEDLSAAIEQYDRHFNTYTGQGFVADLNASVRDEDARLVFDALLSRAGHTIAEGSS